MVTNQSGEHLRRVAILDDYQNVALSSADWSAVARRADITVFRDHVEDLDRLVERLLPFEIVVLMRERTPFPRELIERLPNLRCIVTAGMRNRSIDLAAAAERGIVVSGTENVGLTTVEHTWALILALARNIPVEDRGVREGAWQLTIGRSLAGRTLGVIGLGKIGARVAGVAKALDMEVIAWSQNLTEERCREVGVRRVAFADLLRTADVLTVHLVLSDRSRGLIGRDELSMMKPSALLVNTSRAPIVDQAPLREALEQGRIAGAAIDVFDREPLPADDPMRRLPNTVLTPHIGYVTDRNYEVFYGQSVDAVMAYLDGAPIRRLEPV